MLVDTHTNLMWYPRPPVERVCGVRAGGQEGARAQRAGRGRGRRGGFHLMFVRCPSLAQFSLRSVHRGTTFLAPLCFDFQFVFELFLTFARLLQFSPHFFLRGFRFRGRWCREPSF